MAAHNDLNTSASSNLHSPSQPESFSSKFLRKSKFLVKPNVIVESSETDNCTSTDGLFSNPESSAPSSPSANQSPSDMTAPVAVSDIKVQSCNPPVSFGILLHAKDIQSNKESASSTPLSPENRTPPSPLMEIIPPPSSHPLQATTSLESAPPVASSDTNVTSIPELTEMQHTPCRLCPS